MSAVNTTSENYERLLEKLAVLAQEVGTAREVVTVYRALYKFVCASAPCNGFFVSLYDAERQERRCVYVCTEGREDDPSSLPPLGITGSPSSRAAVSGEIIITDDFPAAMAGKPRVDLSLDIDPRHPQSSLCVPMKVLGKVIGVFEVQSVLPAAYNQEHVTAMRMAANFAGIATQNVLMLEREREQAALLDISQDAIIVRDLEHRILFWNKGAENIYGWTKEEVLGRSALELMVLDEPARIERTTAEVIEQGLWRGECRHRTKSGKKLTLESHWSLVKKQGKPVSILIVNTDITEKKQLERQMLRAQRLESIGMLAGGIAHDLNNVLAPVLLSIELLKANPPEEKRLKVLSTIEATVTRGAELIKQILSFARGIEGERVPLVIRHILTDIEKFIRETFPRHIELNIDLPSDLWKFKGDPTQIHQVLMNLCVNARDAMPHGGMLNISAANTVINEQCAHISSEAKAGEYLVITVADTGCGIEPEVFDKIFEPFFTTKEIGQGTGLGLSVAIGIIRSHGGFITAHSEVGKGTQFHLYLPADRCISEAQASADAHGEITPQSGCILVIDDEYPIRLLTKEALEDFGFEVLTAADGTEGIALYLEHRDSIRVVVTDMMMPVMDGVATIRALKSINPDVKIIAATGQLNNEKSSAVTQLGIRNFLTKPYSTELLLKAIIQIL